MRSFAYILVVTLVSLAGCERKLDSTSQSVVVAQAKSPTGTLTAEVVKKNDQYRFAIRSRNGTLSVVEDDFVPVGYHDPILKVRWNETGDIAIVTVDHDFGEGIRKFVYDTRDFSWKQLE
jgi:hypothetical protein